MLNRNKNINWTFSVIYQIFDEEDRKFFEYLKEDIEFAYQLENNNIHFFVLIQDDVHCIASTLTINEIGKLEKILHTESLENFYSNTDVVVRIWTSFFKFPASYLESKHFVMTQGHAAGLGFFVRSIDQKKRQILGKYPKLALKILLSHSIVYNASDQRSKQKFRDFFSSPSHRSSDLDSARELVDDSGIIPLVCFKNAIEANFKDKIDFVYLGNCFMQTLENGYLLKDRVKYLAAAEGFYFVTGSDYRSLFKTLNSSSGDNFKLISDVLVDGIHTKLNDSRIVKKYSDKPFRLMEIDSQFSFSVNSLDRYEDIKNTLNDLAKELLENFNKLIRILKSIREDPRITRDVFDRQQLGITDLLRFFKNLGLQPRLKANFQKIHEEIETMNEIFDDPKNPLLISKRFPYGAFDPTKEGGVSVFPHGVSVFFPRKKPIHNELDAHITYFINEFYIKEDLLGPFLKDNAWKDFIIKYYNTI